jgi:hypothetical protein
MRMNWSQLCKLGQELPEVASGTWYGMPALKVRTKSFVGLKQPGIAVFRLESTDEQEFLLETDPDVYFITDHYRGYAAVLVRLAALKTRECRIRLERAWRVNAPPKLVKAFDARA